MQGYATNYADEIYAKSKELPNCVGFIDGTFIGILRPGGNLAHVFMCDGNKCNHSMKFQAVVALDGLLLHVAGPLFGRRYYWRMYVSSGLEENLPDVLKHGREAVLLVRRLFIR